MQLATKAVRLALIFFLGSALAAASPNDLRVRDPEKPEYLYDERQKAERITEDQKQRNEDGSITILTADDGVEREKVMLEVDSFKSNQFLFRYNSEINATHYSGHKIIDMSRQIREYFVDEVNGVFTGAGTEIYWKDENDRRWTGTTKPNFDFKIDEENQIIRVGKIESEFYTSDARGYIEVESKGEGEKRWALGAIEYTDDATMKLTGKVTAQETLSENGQQSGVYKAWLESESKRYVVEMNYERTGDEITCSYVVKDRLFVDSKDGVFAYNSDEPNMIGDVDHLARELHVLGWGKS